MTTCVRECPELYLIHCPSSGTWSSSLGTFGWEQVANAPRPLDQTKLAGFGLQALTKSAKLLDAIFFAWLRVAAPLLIHRHLVAETVVDTSSLKKHWQNPERDFSDGGVRLTPTRLHRQLAHGTSSPGHSTRTSRDP